MIADLQDRLRRELGKTVIGQDEAVRLLLIALVADGHVLLEGVPGVAKTLLARTLARALGMQFKRVQFTPDLMPSDVIGTQVFDFQRGAFHLVEGPVFTQMLLADEINRAPAKTQAALLEAMQERQVSIEGEGRKLPSPFLVIATQNPVEQQGTYPLPEAQLDRFLFKLEIGYPSLAEETSILEQHSGDSAGQSQALESVQQVVQPGELEACRAQAIAMEVRPEVRRYLLELVRRTRDDVHVQLGGSPRAAVLLQLAARVAALLDGRDFVVPDDVKSLFSAVLRHRIVLTAAAEVEGLDADDVLRNVADSVEVPR